MQPKTTAAGEDGAPANEQEAAARRQHGPGAAAVEIPARAARRVLHKPHASLGSRVEDAVAVIETVVRGGLHRGGPLVVIGHSEGSDVGPGVAVRSPQVSHLALLGFSATHGLVDVLDEQRRALAAGRISGEEFRQGYQQIVTRFREIRARPSSAERYYGHSFKRWASFGLGRPLEDLLQVRVPIFLGIASEDRPAPPFGADLAVSAFVTRGKDNLTVRNYPGYDHGFFEDDPSGPASRQAEVLRDLLAWIHSHPTEVEASSR